MLDENSRQVKSNAEVANPSPDNVEEAIRRQNIHDNQEKDTVAWPNPYPNRPGEPNCDYYMRTGLCGYGSNCRYNHPPPAAQGTHSGDEFPERVGKPDCGYYLKTGTCKYGSTCKYHHPKDRNGAGPVLFNILGLPMRQDEKSCAHFMRYGSCKFGVACKFNHPQPASLRAGLPLNGAASFGSTGSSVMPSGMPRVVGVPSWSLSRATYAYDQSLQGSQAYMPVVLSPSQGMILASDWNTYVGSLSSLSFGGISASPFAYNSRNRIESGLGAQHNMLATTSASLPERPDQPECRYFMSNGTCKYGPECKYHHPRERIVQFATSLVGPNGLPSRPGQVICPNYTTYGLCKFGLNCKFDHPLLGYSYSYPYPAAYDASLLTYSGTAQTSFMSESSFSTFPGWIQKPDGASRKHQYLEVKTKTSHHLSEPAGSPPPHSSRSSSEPPLD